MPELLRLNRMEQLLADEMLGDDTFMPYVESRGLDPWGAGEFCANMAKTAFTRLGLDPADPENRELGGAITTVGLVCFEAALRLQAVIDNG